MGYSTDFNGILKFDKELTVTDYNFLKKLSETRRMGRNVDEKYGVEGEFYVDGGDNDASVINVNSPPKTQPGLWLQWTPTEDGWGLKWDGGEKFYNYVEWLEYLIEKVIEPRGYILNGEVEWYGEDRDDAGKITVKDNIITIQEAKTVYEERE